MVEFHGSPALLVVARFILAILGAFAVVCSYYGFSEPGNVSPLGAIALGVTGIAILAFAFFAPARWCATVFRFCQ